MLTLSNKQVVESALRKIGEYSFNDPSANDSAIEVGLFWLDLVVGHYTSVNDAYWLISNTFAITLIADQISYNLENALGTDAKEEGVFFVEAAYVNDGNNREVQIDILRRDQYESIENKTASGTPNSIYVDRQTPTETLYTYPVMGSGGSYTIKLVLRQYSEDITKKRIAATHGLPPEWQLWMIKALAAEIGDGPVRKLPVNEIKALKSDADILYKQLLAYSNREHDSGYRTARFDV